MKEMQSFDLQLRSLSEGGISWPTTCEQTSGSPFCFRSHENPLGFWETINHDYNVDSTTPYQVVYRIQSGRGPATLYPEWDPHFIPVTDMYSGRLPNNLTVEATGANDVCDIQIYYFEAIQFEYTLQVEDEDVEDLEPWEDALDDLVEKFNSQAAFIRVDVYSLRAMGKDFVDALKTDIALYIAALLFIFMYWIFALGRCHPLYCRLPLSFGVFASFIMSVSMSLALPNYIGVTFVSSTAFISLMIVVVTILYSSTLLKAVDMVKPGEGEDIDSTERFARGYKYAGVSLFKTFLIGTCSFGIAARSDIPAIRSFCATGACCMAFIFWNTLTFFGGCLYADSKRVFSNKPDCCGLCMCNEKSALFCRRKCVMDAAGEPAVSSLEMMIVKYINRLQMNYWARFVFIALYVIVIAIGIAAFFRVRHEFQGDWLVKDKSASLQHAIDVKDKFFNDRGSVFGMYITDTQFISTETQLSLIQLSSALRDCTGCSQSWLKPGSVFSFYDSLRAWVQQGLCYDTLNANTVRLNSKGVIDSYEFNVCLQNWLQTPQGAFFTNDVVFDKSGNVLMARIVGRLRYFEQERDAVQAKLDLTDIGNDFGPGSTFPYNSNFLYYEQFAELQPQAMFFGYLLFVFSFGWHLITGAFPLTALLCAVNVFAVYLGFAVTMWALEVEFNAVSVLHSYMCGVLAFQFSTHIIHVYITQSGTASQRLEGAYRYICSTIPHFLVSVLLAIVIFFTPANTYVFVVFGKLVRFTQWGGFLVFLSLDCFFVLPALLSLVGPADPPPPGEKIEAEESFTGLKKEAKEVEIVTYNRR